MRISIVCVLLGFVASAIDGSREVCKVSKQSTITDIDDYIKLCTEVVKTDLRSLEKEINKQRILKNPNTTGSHIENGLKSLNISIKQLFTLQSWHGLETRSNLPFLRTYIGDKVDQLYNLHLGSLIKLLGNVGQLLRIAYAGCKGNRCSRSVVKIMYMYQQFVSDSTRLTQNLVNVCIRALRYHRYAYYFATVNKSLDKSLKQYKRILAIAEQIRISCQAFLYNAKKFRNLILNAFDQAAGDVRMSKANEGKYRKHMIKYARHGLTLDSNEAMMKVQAKELRILAANLKEKTKIDYRSVLEFKKANLSSHCPSVTLLKFNKMCKIAGRWLSSNSSNCEKQKDYINESYCRKTIDILLTEEGKEELKKLAKHRQDLHIKRGEYEKKKSKVQKMKMKQFKHFNVTAKLLKRLKLKPMKEGDLWFAVVPLFLTVRSMVLVESQIKKITQFWDEIIEDKKELVIHDITGGNVSNIMKEKVLESGFSWIAIGKVLRIAAMKMRSVSFVVDHAFMTIPTRTEVKTVIDAEAKAMFDEAKSLHDHYATLNKKQKQTGRSDEN